MDNRAAHGSGWGGADLQLGNDSDFSINALSPLYEKGFGQNMWFSTPCNVDIAELVSKETKGFCPACYQSLSENLIIPCCKFVDFGDTGGFRNYFYI
jgi:hypothetical protein